jgi:hypothetical protein
MADYGPVYGLDQLAGYGVVISNKPPRSRESLVNAPRLSAIRRSGASDTESPTPPNE